MSQVGSAVSKGGPELAGFSQNVTDSLASAQMTVHGFEAVVCNESMRKLMQMVERVARSNASVLISGETGSGKEFVARALHHHSLRCHKPWVDLNCAALPEHLVESELFGYEKGAFSGAESMKQGLFELATGGTLFLDEIGELEPKVQVKLLRVLDGAPYYRLGGNRKVAVDARVIAATNQELEAAVKTGRFRSDLYHRLGQIQLRIPPLRERPEDIDALAEYFLQQQRPGLHFSLAALTILRNYSWPGNVRELRNVVIQSAMIAEGNELRPNDLPPEIGIGSTQPVEVTAPITKSARITVQSTVTDLEELEKQTILRALTQTGGHQGKAAEQLGISRRTLSRKLKLYNLNSDRDDAGPLGVLNREQQHYFRAAVDQPVMIRNNKGEEFQAQTINISSGGMCVTGIDNPLQCAGELLLRFALPESGSPVETKARVAWADVQKKAGLRFLNFPVEAQLALDRWLHQRQQEEGWTIHIG